MSNNITILRKFCKAGILRCIRFQESHDCESDREMYNFYAGCISTYREIMREMDKV